MSVGLELLRKSRRIPRPGDMFVLKMVGGPFLVGVVIVNDAVIGSWKEGVLIYVYDFMLCDPVAPSLDLVTTDRLLLPPLIINRLPWGKGYFETIGRVSLDAVPRFKTHCFRHPFFGYLRDEYGNAVNEPCEHEGELALFSYRGVAERVRAALAERGVDPDAIGRSLGHRKSE